MKRPPRKSGLSTQNTPTGADGDDVCRIDLRPTIALHQRLADRLPTEQDKFYQTLVKANHSLRSQDRTFDNGKDLSVALSALSLSASDINSLQHVAETLHDMVETLLSWLLDDADRLDQTMADHRRIFPFLSKTQGCDRWQVFSRYDAVLTGSGEIKILELNTGCPAGFMHARSFTRAVSSAMDSLGVFDSGESAHPATIRTEALVDGLLQLERDSSIEPALIGLLNDENGLQLELDLLAEAFAGRGREARMIDAAELEFQGGQLLHAGDPISLTLNKFRISVPTSENHFWKTGFESRYAAFLAAQKAGAVISANNLAALTIAEDKSLLGLFSLPLVQELFTPKQRQFAQRHILWTCKLADRTARWQDEEIDLLPFIREHRETLVIKPCNEGRGFGVVIGRECSPDEWSKLCEVDANTPRVVQEYVEPLSLPVVCGVGQGVAAEEMYLTLGLAVVLGKYEGLLSRVSPSRVTNVAREGYVQAVFQRDGC